MRIKFIQNLIDRLNGKKKFNIILAKLMSRKYFCNISDAIKLMLPPGTGRKKIDSRTKEKTGNFVFLNKDVEEILDENMSYLNYNEFKEEWELDCYCPI